MIAQSRFLKRRGGGGGPAGYRKKKQQKKTTDENVLIGVEKKDPYAIPVSEKLEGKRVVLSNDPLIRDMIGDQTDTKYDNSDLQCSTNNNEDPAPSQSSKVPSRRWNRWISKINSHKNEFQKQEISFNKHWIRRRFSKFNWIHNRSSRKRKKMTAASTRRHLNSTCLWHSCRAVTIGTILIISGIVMAILGFLDDEEELQKIISISNQTIVQYMFGPGMEREDSFKLNNLSFAGPVVMGIGGSYRDIYPSFHSILYSII